jgi:hypothetical protein
MFVAAKAKEKKKPFIINVGEESVQGGAHRDRNCAEPVRR